MSKADLIFVEKGLKMPHPETKKRKRKEVVDKKKTVKKSK